MKNIGLYFGSFNPIHIGHLIIANYVLQHTGLDELWFVISPQNPFKKQEELASENDRLNMVKLAIEGSPKLMACDVEFSLERPSYTANTLQHLKALYPTFQFCVVLGEDNKDKFHLWKEFEWILREFPIIFYPRPGSKNENSHIPWDEHRVQIIDAPLIGISSTQIRNEIRSGGDIRFMTPDVVLEYLHAHHIYS